MILETVTSFSNGYAYVKRHPQLLMTILLVVVIPFAFVFSGQQFLEAGRQNQDRLEKDRIGIMHDVFASYMRAVAFDDVRMQSEIEHISSLNPDIRSFMIAQDMQSSVRIVASNISESIGAEDTNTMQYRIANANPNETLISPYAENGVRYWRSYRLVRAENGDTYYIFTETSLSHIDTLFANRIAHAFYWLIGILAVVMYLIFRHVRLIDYAYLYQQTKRANDMKDMFTNMIAHELRAPLTAMRGYASMIRQKEGVDEHTKEYAVRIEDASERLVVIVSDLLDVARIQSGKLSMQPARTNIQPIITAVLDTMRAQAREKDIELKKEGLYGDVVINVDGKRLHQALTNLVSNAMKYTPKGVISLELSDAGSVVEIRVKDTGMGISAENQKNLFAPFFRVKRTEVDAIVGTGLGMWITKQLIELMKGSIGVESIKGVGTHIVITLPK
jgi:signal transduction histidine kinase